MKFGLLHIENFLTIGEAKLNLEGQGLVLIQGENLDDPSADSNGAGKSTIPDAICWVLYGKTARGVTGDAVINRTAKKNCRVALMIKEDGKTRYVVKRNRKHKTGKNSLQLWMEQKGMPVNISKGTDRETQILIEQIMGCSYEVFTSAVYAGQDQMPDLPGLTDKFLKQLVEEAAGITVLDAAHLKAREAFRTSESALDRCRENLVRLEEKQGLQEEELERQRVELEDWEVQRDADVKTLKTSASEKMVKIKAHGLEIADKADLEAQYEDTRKKLASVEDEGKQKDLLTKKLTSAKLKKTAAGTEYNTARNNAMKSKTDLEGIEGRIGTPCGECGRPYDEKHIEGARDLAKEKLHENLLILKRCKSDGEATEKSVLEALTELTDYKASMTDLSETVERQQALNEDLKQIGKIETSIASLKAEARGNVLSAKAKLAEENPHVSLIEKAKLACKETYEKVIDIKEMVEAGLRDLTTAKEVVGVFSPAGVRAHILDTVTPYLNDRTSHYLGTLSDGNIAATWSTISTTAKGEMREKFEIAVTNDCGAATFLGLSGGEKRKVRLACALALQDLVASRATKPIELFLADEIDDALDSAGLERLMVILDEKARERGSILVISHNDLKDWIRTQWTVRKEGGFSTVEIAA